jgi:hypothetical protein
MKWTSWVSLLGLGAIIGVVVWTSLDVGAVRCEVCITFEGRQACRSVDGATADEAAHRRSTTRARALVGRDADDGLRADAADQGGVYGRP